MDNSLIQGTYGAAFGRGKPKHLATPRLPSQANKATGRGLGGLGFKVWGLGFKVWGSGFRGLGVWGFRFRLGDLGFRELRVQGFGVSGLWV